MFTGPRRVHGTHLVLRLLLFGLLLGLLLRLLLLLLGVEAILATRTSLFLSLSGLLLLLLDTLDAWIYVQRQVDECSQACGVLLLTAGALGLVLLLCVALVVTAVGVSTEVVCPGKRWDLPIASLVHLLVHVLEAPPAVKVVPELVEALDSLLGVVDPAEHGHGLYLAEAGFAFEYRTERLEEILVGVLGSPELLLGWDVLLELLVVRVD